jgi:subtilisin-like proprotein convertase family protein
MISAFTLSAQGFSGSFDPANWQLVSTGDGSVNTAAAPTSIVLTGNDNGAAGNTDYTITMVACGSGELYFNWMYNSIDGPTWDNAGYIINGNYSQIANVDATSGIVGPITINAGDVFGFRVYSVDGSAGAGIFTISNFLFNSDAVTVNAGADFSMYSGLNFTMNASASSTTLFSSSASPNAAITDFSNTSSVISVPVNVNASQIISLNLNINHTYDGDLVISLMAPNASSIMLANGLGDAGQNYVNTTFSTSGTPITSGVPPFTGVFTPQESFSLLTGSSLGDWTLNVYDQYGGDNGVLIDWSITIDNMTYSWSPAAGLSSATI